MSLLIGRDGFCPPINKVQSPTQKYLKLNDKICHSLKVAGIFAVNYVATVRGTDLDKVEQMISDKTFVKYEKNHHPVYLKLIIKENEKLAELIIQQIKSLKEQKIYVKCARVDNKNAKYLHIVSTDLLHIENNRIFIFNVINNDVLKIIRKNLTEFGTSRDMQQNGYFIPNDLSVVERHISIYCLPPLSSFVSAMKKKLSSPLEKIFLKKGLITKKHVRTTPKRSLSFFRKNNYLNSPKPTKNDNLISQSIETLPLTNGDVKDISGSLNDDQFFHSSTNISNSSSIQSSFNDQSQDISDPILCKFEHLLQNDMGLKWFKEFVTKEVSSENILFWEAVQDFSKIDDVELLKKTASEIFLKYIDPDSDTSVNLECDIIKNTRKLLTNPNREMFTTAGSHIFYLMKTDSYNRFRKSKYFELWHDEFKYKYIIKPASSTSSLNQIKKRKTLLPNFFRNKNKKTDDFGNSSQTLDSESNGIIQTSTCKITMSLEYSETHCVLVQTNKKLIQVLKNIDKQFSESEAVAFDEFDNKIVPFNENMVRSIGRSIVIEKSVIIRVGFVQLNMDTVLFEYVWFVIRPRYNLCLSNALDPVAKRLDVDLSNYAVIKEDDTNEIPWNSQIFNLNKCCLFLIERNVLNGAKFYAKSLTNNIESLWKKILPNDSFISTLPFDNDNVLDSRNEIFSKYKLEPRKVGYIIYSSINDERVESIIHRVSQNGYDDQRGICSDDQMLVPEFLKTFRRLESDESSSLSSKDLSDIFICDSDLSLSELDELSDDSSLRLQFASDLE